MTRNIINKNKIQRVHYPGLIGVHAYLLFSRWCHDYCSSDRLTLLSSRVLSLEKARLRHPRCIYNPRWVCRSWCHPNTTSLFHFWSCCCWWRRRIRKISALWRGVVWSLLRNKSTASNLYRKFETITYKKTKNKNRFLKWFFAVFV